MCMALQQSISDIALYIFDTPDENAAKRAEGLTKHCIGAADKMVVEGVTASQWLWDAVCGNPRQIGLSLLDQILE